MTRVFMFPCSTGSLAGAEFFALRRADGSRAETIGAGGLAAAVSSGTIPMGSGWFAVATVASQPLRRPDWTAGARRTARLLAMPHADGRGVFSGAPPCRCPPPSPEGGGHEPGEGQDARPEKTVPDPERTPCRIDAVGGQLPGVDGLTRRAFRPLPDGCSPPCPGFRNCGRCATSGRRGR